MSIAVYSHLAFLCALLLFLNWMSHSKGRLGKHGVGRPTGWKQHAALYSAWHDTNVYICHALFFLLCGSFCVAAWDSLEDFDICLFSLILLPPAYHLLSHYH